MALTALPNAFVQEEPLEPPAVERLGEVVAPTLVIVGELDDATIANIGDLLTSGIAKASRLNIPGAAHLPNMEKPELFNQAVLDFLQQASPRSNHP